MCFNELAQSCNIQLGDEQEKFMNNNLDDLLINSSQFLCKNVQNPLVSNVSIYQLSLTAIKTKLDTFRLSPRVFKSMLNKVASCCPSTV